MLPFFLSCFLSTFRYIFINIRYILKCIWVYLNEFEWVWHEQQDLLALQSTDKILPRWLSIGVSSTSICVENTSGDVLNFMWNFIINLIFNSLDPLLSFYFLLFLCSIINYSYFLIVFDYFCNLCLIFKNNHRSVVFFEWNLNWKKWFQQNDSYFEY